VAILTGARISAESGVPTFRGETGLWRGYKPEDLATPEAFARAAAEASTALRLWWPGQDTVIQRYLPSLRWSPGVTDFLEKGKCGICMIEKVRPWDSHSRA